MSDAVVMDVKATREARTERWGGVVEQWQKSGQSRAAFCREQSVSLWQLCYWIKRFAAPVSSAGTAEAGGFVQVTPPAAGGSGVVLRLRTGVEVELQPGFDAATLKRLLDLVLAPC